VMIAIIVIPLAFYYKYAGEQAEKR
jgi:hypothetical protein